MKLMIFVKEKAMVKLKEVKAKSEDSGSKARQYLEGLLRIPFNTFKEEPILSLIPNALTRFRQLIKTLHGLPLTCPVTARTSIAIKRCFIISTC